MTIIEQLKVEIERLLKSQIQHFDSMGGPTNFDIATLGWVLEKISTIESEHLADARKISQKDLEEAAVEYSKKVSDGQNYRDLRVGFIAGANWGREQTAKEAVKWLKETGANNLYISMFQRDMEEKK